MIFVFFFFFQAEDGIRDVAVTGVQTCALPIWWRRLDRGDDGSDEGLADSVVQREIFFPSSPPWHGRTEQARDALLLWREGLLPRGQSALGDLSRGVPYRQAASCRWGFGVGCWVHDRRDPANREAGLGRTDSLPSRGADEE